MKHVAIALAPWRRSHLKWVMLGFKQVAVDRDWRLTPLYMSQWMGEDPWEAIHDPIEGLIAGDMVDSMQKVLDRPCPKVIVGPLGRGHGVPCIAHDYVAVARMGVEHFSARGYGQVAFFSHGDPNRWDTQGLQQGIEEAAIEHGMDARIFSNGPRTARRGHWVLTDQIADLADALKSWSLPLGLLCFDDEHAFRALQACRLAELNVPEQVAVLGIGDDEFVCEFANPTLSSISLNYEQAGRVAAQRLGAIMDEKYAPAESVVQPIGVTQRESTGYVALNDPDVRDALRLIRESLEDKLTVDDLAAAVHVSPRTLLRKFKQTLGRSPGELVRQMRLDEARRLIISTDLTFQQIATRTGLGAASQFGHAIKNATGQSPGELRKDYRMR